VIGADDQVPYLRGYLIQLYIAVGKPSYNELKRQADHLGLALPTSTVGDLLKGPRVPRRDTVEAFVSACRRWTTQQKKTGSGRG
jgi:hypothetical protein